MLVLVRALASFVGSRRGAVSQRHSNTLMGSEEAPSASKWGRNFFINKILGYACVKKKSFYLSLCFLVPQFHLIFAGTLEAAEFSENVHSDVHMISVIGELLPGDEKKMLKFFDKKIHKVVVLESPGGSVNTALIIGSGISIYGYSTIVPDKSFCASACALVWLFGKRRYLHRSSKIGFHVAYVESAGGYKYESGLANGLIGAHLAEVGINKKTLEYIMSPKPNEIRWLSFDDAVDIGLNLIPYGEKQ